MEIEAMIGCAPLEVAERCLDGVRYPHFSLEGAYEAGSAEPYVAQAICGLLVASGGRTALECGGYLGLTSSWLALTLEQMGGGELHVAELEADRAQICSDRLSSLPIPNVKWRVYHDDVFNVIASLPYASIDFAWVDDNHEHSHVDRELAALIPKMSRGGIITGHDVHGVCNLWREFAKHGGYSIDLPRFGPAGGIGIIQVT